MTEHSTFVGRERRSDVHSDQFFLTLYNSAACQDNGQMYAKFST